MRVNPCSADVSPVIPENFIGDITFPEVVSLDAAGNETLYTGPVQLISRKSYDILFPFSSTAIAGIITLTIVENPLFFSNVYRQMLWEAKEAATYLPLFWRINGEIYDFLSVSFSPEDCDLESGSITYEIIPNACDPCETESC